MMPGGFQGCLDPLRKCLLPESVQDVKIKMNVSMPRMTTHLFSADEDDLDSNLEKKSMKYCHCKIPYRKYS